MLSFHPGTRVFVVEVVPVQFSSTLLYLSLCTSGALCEISLFFAICSKYLTQASDQSMASWDFLYVSSFCHLSQIDVNTLLPFVALRNASSALWRCSCHKLGPCLQPFAEIANVRKHGAFRISKAALLRRIISVFGAGSAIRPGPLQRAGALGLCSNSLPWMCLTLRVWMTKQ